MNNTSVKISCPSPPTGDQWQVISENNQAFDGVFWYAVKTTKIFCRPSCPSRQPKKEHVEIYYSTAAARKNGFQPCKRCQPCDSSVSKEARVKEIDGLLNLHYQQPLSLSDLAILANLSESYLRHIYQELTGQTPHQKLRALRMAAAEKLLLETNQSIRKITRKVGMSNESYFSKSFRKAYGIPPLQYRKTYAKH